jgi:hypothetical protein
MVLGAYAFFYQAGGWNQNSRFDLTRAIVERGTSQIDAYHRNTGDKARRGEHFYCDKAPGVSWIAVPPVAAANLLRGAQATPRYLAVSSWIATVWTVGIPSAVAVVMLYLLLLALRFSPAAALGGAAAWGLASLAFPYATLFYGHQLVAALTLTAFTLLVRLRAREGDADPPTLVAVGFLLGAAVAVEYPALLPGAVIFGYAGVAVRPRRRVLWIIAGGVAPALALAIYHWACFGSPGTLPYAFSTQKHRHMGFFMGLGVPSPRVIGMILFSSYRGIFYSMPWLLLAAPGAVFLWMRRARAEVITCAAIVVLFVWLNASLVDWEGGWAMGARYLVPALPFLAILAAGVLDPPPAIPRSARIAFAALFGAAAAVAFTLMLVGVSVKPEVYVKIQHPFSQYLLPAFRRGALAISTQSIDAAGAPEHGPRFAWNLGQLMGLRGLWSLAPLMLWLAAGGAWIIRQTRARA